MEKVARVVTSSQYRGSAEATPRAALVFLEVTSASLGGCQAECSLTRQFSSLKHFMPTLLCGGANAACGWTRRWPIGAQRRQGFRFSRLAMTPVGYGLSMFLNRRCAKSSRGISYPT